jgi:hypothetical protein
VVNSEKESGAAVGVCGYKFTLECEKLTSNIFLLGDDILSVQKFMVGLEECFYQKNKVLFRGTVELITTIIIAEDDKKIIMFIED